MKSNNIIQMSREFEKNLDSADGGRISIRRRTNGSRRRVSGSFFTPTGLVAYSVKFILDSWMNNFKGRKNNEIISRLVNLKIIDPAVGTGLFLLGCRQYLREEVPKLMHVNSQTLESAHVHQCGISNLDATGVGSTWDRWIVENILWGADINPDALNVCRDILHSGFEGEPPEVNLLEADSLTLPIKSFKEWLRRKSNLTKWDIIIGNPPWGTELPRESNLDYSSCKGESALAFCDLANYLTDGKGIISFVMPSSWLQASSWTEWRKNNLHKLRLNQVYFLPCSTFPGTTYTAPPMLAIFGLNTNLVKCEKLNLDNNFQESMIDGMLISNIEEFYRRATTQNISEILIEEISNFPAYRMPLASKWWIDNFYGRKENQDSIFNLMRVIVRGVKTGNNKKFIKKYSNEEVRGFNRPIINGFPGDPPQWCWLAKGGLAKVKGKPTYFLQPTTHIIRWDITAVHNYNESNGLRNSQYYGEPGVGFPSSGRHSPVFRHVRNMVFDADYIVIIPKKEEDALLLLSICNSPAFLFAAKHLFNHSVHFKMSDICDMYFPRIDHQQQIELRELAQHMFKALETGDKNAELNIFKDIHKMLVKAWNIPSIEEKKCIEWYIKRFPGMKSSFA